MAQELNVRACVAAGVREQTQKAEHGEALRVLEAERDAALGKVRSRASCASAVRIRIHWNQNVAPLKWMF